MTIKRVLFALISLMLLPALATAQPGPPEPDLPRVSPETGTAAIAVYKEFSDGNEEDSVTVTLTCTGGTIAPTSADLGHQEYQIFVVDNLPASGPDIECTVTESVPAAYSPTYWCRGPEAIDPADDCWPPEDGPSSTSCQFGDVVPNEGRPQGPPTEGSVGYCIIENDPNPVDVDVTKVWEFFGADIIEVDTDVRLTLVCDAEIVGGTTWNINDWYKTITLSGSDYFDEDGVDVGIGTAEFSVIPEWYSTSEDPDDQRFTRCYVKEDAGAQSAVDVDNGCGEDFGDAEIMVAAGMGDSCTVTNTVFFEGIPTLSQYGMAIMALLMLGLGFVGMRRFV